MSRARFHLAAVLAALLAACGTTGLEGTPDAPLDAPVDPVVDPPTDPGIDPPGPGITFEISFITDVPGYEHLFVQASDAMGHQTWASIPGQALQWRCDLCQCDECSGCAVCGPAETIVERVAAGDSTRWTWDGTLHPLATCTPGPGGPEEPCQETGRLDAGTYTARFCWAAGPEDAFPDGWIPDPVCDTVTFDYPVGGDGVVGYLVNHGG